MVQLVRVATCGFSILLTLGAYAAHASVSLDDAYRAAVSRSESVAIAGHQLEQAEARYSQALGGVFPTINGVASYQRLDPPDGPESAFTRSDRPEVKLTASQPLFRGFREFAAIRQKKAEIAAQDRQREQAGALLYGDVAQNFFSILAQEQDLRDLETQLDLNRKRAEELQARVRIGRSREGEVLTIRSSVANLEAQAEVLRGQIRAARELFGFLTGLDAKTELRDDEKAPPTQLDLESYLARIEKRPDIKTQFERLNAAQEGISIARGGHLPWADLTGNYYLVRTGILEQQKWDVVATLTVPIYSGGVVQSQVRESVSRSQEADLALGRARRVAEQEIRALGDTIRAQNQQLQALEKAAELAERNYQVQTRDYRYGLVTNIDVLQSLNSFQEIRRALDRARFTAKYDFVRLQIAAAQRPGDQK